MKKHSSGIIVFSLFVIPFMAALFFLYGFAVENNASVFEIRKQAEKGHIAVVTYDSTSGITLSTSNGTYTEKNTDNEMKLSYSANEGIDSYLRKGNDGIYLTGTYDNTAIAFYVRETESEFSRLQVEIKGIDEKMYFASIGSTQSPDVNTTIRVGIQDGYGLQWLDMLSECTSATEQYCTVDYTRCPYDSEKNAYQVIIRVDEGMACFTKIELTGLDLVDISGDKTDISYQNGVLADAHDAEMNADYMSVKNQMMSDAVYPADNSSIIRNFLFRLYNFILRITTLLKSIFTVLGGAS